MPVNRESVYAAIDSERDYQEAGAGNARRHANMPGMTPGEIILCMEKCLQDARDAWYKPNGGEACIPFVRKVAGLAVQAMELYGAPQRVGFEHKPYPKLSDFIITDDEIPF